MAQSLSGKEVMEAATCRGAAAASAVKSLSPSRMFGAAGSNTGHGLAVLTPPLGGPKSQHEYYLQSLHQAQFEKSFGEDGFSGLSDVFKQHRRQQELVPLVG